MNTLRTTAVLIALSLLLAACASNPRTVDAPGAAAPRATLDREYVETINRANHDAGNTVHWINPPRPINRED